MPDWVLHWLLPIVIQAVTPYITEGIKRLVELLKDKMPGGMIVAVAGIVGEVVNQLQGQLSGVPLPPGMSGLLAIALRELKKDFEAAAGKTPSGI